MRREPNARMPGEERRIVHVSDILHTVALLEHLDVPEEAVGPNFINEEHLAHPSVGGEVGSIEPPLVCWGKDDKDLDLPGVLDPNDFFLEVEVFSAVVSEHHNE